MQKTFERFSVGKPGDKSMNQKTFQEFCEEMGMVNPGEGLQHSLCLCPCLWPQTVRHDAR